MNNNQFGYQKNLSCKHAYFVLNECIHFHHSQNLKVEVAQLDAEKAFDTLWRVGLYYKLMDEIDDVFFRSLVNYFANSAIIVKYNGVKQGGVLSGYLFNFNMDSLIQDCVDTNIGCKIGDHNVSVIAYCDDLFLIATTKTELDILLNKVDDYALDWKIKFNIKKCINLTIYPPSNKSK